MGQSGRDSSTSDSQTSLRSQGPSPKIHLKEPEVALGTERMAQKILMSQLDHGHYDGNRKIYTPARERGPVIVRAVGWQECACALL